MVTHFMIPQIDRLTVKESYPGSTGFIIQGPDMIHLCKLLLHFNITWQLYWVKFCHLLAIVSHLVVKCFFTTSSIVNRVTSLHFRRFGYMTITVHEWTINFRFNKVNRPAWGRRLLHQKHSITSKSVQYMLFHPCSGIYLGIIFNL